MWYRVFSTKALILCGEPREEHFGKEGLAFMQLVRISTVATNRNPGMDMDFADKGGLSSLGQP